jgi:hypothetical protein
LALTGTHLDVSVTQVAGTTRYYQLTFSNPRSKQSMSSYLDLIKSEIAVNNAIDAVASNMLNALK